MLDANRSKLAWLLWLPCFIACPVIGGCEASCDEEAQCSQSKFGGCDYDGCGQFMCSATDPEGQLLCGEEGADGRFVCPEIDQDCATLFSAPQDQTDCTELLAMVMRGSTGSDATACRDAVLDVAPCALGEDFLDCDFASLDVACFDDSLECE